MSRLQKDSTIPSVASTSQEDQGSRTLKVTLLSSEWRSSTDGDLSTINRELAIQLAKHPHVDVSILLPNCSGEDRSSAESHNVKLIEADKVPGVEPVLWLSSPPRNHTMDCVIGHGVHLGRLIPFIKKNPNYSCCKWIQVVHSAPEEDGMYKNISEGEKMQKTEIQLCKMADQVITIGPKLAEVYKRYLCPVKQEENVFDLTPSIFSEFLEVKQATKERKTFFILVIGSGDSYADFNVKGYDIAAKAIAELKDESYKLKFVCAAGGKGDIADKLLHHGISRNQLIIRSFDDSREVLADLFCEVDLAIMPSRTEGFGIKALEALSAGLPVLVSGNSGLGEALKQVLLGSQSVVDSEDPKDWAREIKRVRQKKREVRLSESSLLHEKYLEKYTWEVPCRSLVIKMKKLIFGGNEQVIRNLQQWQQNASRYKISSNTDPLSDLEKIASEKGYKISDNQGSGNCMFYALSEQLETVKGVKIHHFELRRSLVQYLREHPKQVDGTDLFHFVDRHTTWGSYLTDMEQNGTWGDHVILWAAANCYQIAIHVISSLPGHSEVIIKPDCPFDQSKHLVLGHVHEVHYISLQPLQEIRATIPGRDKRPAPVSTDQPHKQLSKELTNHDYCEVNRPPQLAMDYRRENQTAGESTANSSTAIFRPLNVPATSAFPSSQAPSTPAQSTYSMPRGSAASLPANEASYSRSLPLCAVQTDSSSVSMSAEKGTKRKRRMSPGCSNQDLKQPQVAFGDLAEKGKRRKRRVSPGCSNQYPKQPQVASGNLAVKQGTPTDEELKELGNEIAQEWKILGRRLSVREHTLHAIDEDYKELSERGYHMLMCWKLGNGCRATYKFLNNALQHKCVQRKDLAEQICYNHEKGTKRKRRMFPGCSNQDPKQPQVAFGDLAEKRKKRMSPGCSNQDPKQPKVASVDLAGTPNNDELQELGKKIGVKWDTFGRCLGVEEPELENIEQRHKDLEKRGYAMLMHWKQKNGSEATYQILKAALQHKLVQRKDLVEQICDNHDIPDVPRNHFDVKDCRRKLAEHYKRTATVPTSVWSKKCAVNIHEIYTRLSLVKEEQTPAGSSQAGLNHYTEVLTENKNGLPSNRILLQGQTGIGKSTFVKKLAMDWAELDENRLTDEQRAILKKFELAVIIDLKKVSKYQNLRDIISASHIFADEDTAMKDGLLSYITHNQDKVLLVFDGYDEYRFGSNSEIFEIFKRIKLRNCCVLITTRISKADELKEFKDVHAKITGFSGEDSHSFMVRMLGDEIQAGALQDHLYERNLYDLARVPLLLLFFCTLWKKGSAQSFPDSKTKLYVAIVQYVLDHNESKCSPANFRKVEDFKEILAEIGKVALECLMKDDHVFEYDQLSPAIRFCEESRIIGLLQVSEYSENLRPAGMVSFIHKSIQEFLAAWYINYRCAPEGNLGEINDRTRTLDDCRSLENVFQFVCGLSDDGAVKVFEHLKSVRISDSELDLSKKTPDGTDEPLCDITWKRQCFLTLVNKSFGEVQTKTEVLRHYLNCTDGIIFVEGESVREIIPERRILNGITLNGAVWFGKNIVHQNVTKIYEWIEFLDCLDVPLRMTENSVVVAVGEFLRKFEAIRIDSYCGCYFRCILRYHNGQAFFYITHLYLRCNNHADLFDVTNLTSTPSHSTSSSSERFCLKYLSFLLIYTYVKERATKCLVTIFRDCKNLKDILFTSVTKHTCELLQYVPNPRTCRVVLGTFHYASDGYSLTSADVTKLAGLLPQFNNLVSLNLALSDCCAEAVNKLFCSITHKTLEELELYGIILTPVTAAALGRSISEMSSLRMLLISGRRRGFLETGFDRTSLVSQLFTFNTGGCRFLPSLHKLFLERLNLNERGLRELLDNWKFFSELTLLSLYGNPLGDKHTVHSMVKKALPRVHVYY